MNSSRLIAIQPDHSKVRSGRRQSASDRWQELAQEAGFETRIVDVYRSDILEQLRDCCGFMWWFHQRERHLAKRIVFSIEQALRIPVFPDWKTAWHFDDKVGQRYLLDAAGIPAPRTWIFWNHEEALEFCRQAKYPIVLKLAQGIVSENVKLVADRTEAEFWVNNMFGEGVDSLNKWPPPIGWRKLRKRLGAARRMLLGQPLQTVFASLERGYVLFQEFLPGNEFDTRMSVIGDRAFGFRRHNRPGDFRASGSGRIDWDHTQIPPEKVNLAFRAARALQSQCLAMDILHAADRSLSVNEVSCYFEFWAVEACPGHWRADGTWVSGPMKAEDAVFQSFIEQVRKFARTNSPLDAPPPASAVV